VVRPAFVLRACVGRGGAGCRSLWRGRRGFAKSSEQRVGFPEQGPGREAVMHDKELAVRPSSLTRVGTCRHVAMEAQPLLAADIVSGLLHCLLELGGGVFAW